MNLKNALRTAQEARGPSQVLIGTCGGFVLRGNIEGAISDESDVIFFNVSRGEVTGSVERANGSTFPIPTGRLMVPLGSIAWISQEPLPPT